MAEDNKNSYGYGDVDKVVKQTSSQGKYLQFKKGDNGRQIQIRVASEPRYIIQHWVMGDDGKNRPSTCEGVTCSYCGDSVPSGEKLEKKSRWAWIVIDRADGQAKIFMGPNSIALRFRELSELISAKTKNPIWGDPRTFDVSITYTEKSNGFGEYSVEPDPDSRGPLTDEETKLVTDSGFNLEEELKGGKKSEHVGNYSGTAGVETAPEEGVTPENKGVEIEDDTIPF